MKNEKEPQELGALSALTPDPRNGRSHSERNLDLIATSLQEVGAARSIVVDEDGVIFAGNATVTAAQQAGIDRVRVIDTDGSELVAVRRSGLTSEQKRRLALLDNRSAELTSWDTEVLASLADDTDLSYLWEPDELDAVIADGSAPAQLLGDPDEIPDVPDEPTTQSADLWHLGSHHLLCGDDTNPDYIARLMARERATCLWTDPPYGVSYVGKTADALTLANDDAERLEGVLRAGFTTVQDGLAPGASFYIAHPAGALSLVFSQVIASLGWRWRQTLVWVKDSFVLGRSDYHYRHEPILFGYLPGEGRRGRGSAGWYGDDAQDSVFEIPRPKASPDHPTCKPVTLITAMLANSTRAKDLVLDPFGGSGSTLIACEELGRCCHMLELDPRYCDVIVRRWEALTGLSVERTVEADDAA